VAAVERARRAVRARARAHRRRDTAVVVAHDIEVAVVAVPLVRRVRRPELHGPERVPELVRGAAAVVAAFTVEDFRGALVVVRLVQAARAGVVAQRAVAARVGAVGVVEEDQRMVRCGQRAGRHDRTERRVRVGRDVGDDERRDDEMARAVHQPADVARAAAVPRRLRVDGVGLGDHVAQLRALLGQRVRRTGLVGEVDMHARSGGWVARDARQCLRQRDRRGERRVVGVHAQRDPVDVEAGEPAGRARACQRGRRSRGPSVRQRSGARRRREQEGRRDADNAGERRQRAGDTASSHGRALRIDGGTVSQQSDRRETQTAERPPAARRDRG
jgi:hypothetical protein